MNHESAMQCALGYAWGHEDGSKVPTYEPPETSSGPFKFAEAFAQGWDEYNSEQRGMMTSVTAAYARWQTSNGTTIWDDALDEALGGKFWATHAGHIMADNPDQAESIARRDEAGQWTLARSARAPAIPANPHSDRSEHPARTTRGNIMSPQTQVRKMRPHGRRSGPARSSDGIRQTYYDPAIRHARRVTTRRDDADNKEG